jgi:hypothetical protein
VTVKCGHVEKFGWFEDKKDRYRDARRQKLAGRDCKQCRLKKHAEQEAAAAQRRAAKAAQRQDLPQRLPDAARFDVRYDAATTTWSGALAVPIAGNAVSITGTASGVFGLLKQLDRKYRAMATEAAGKVQEG